MTDFPPEVSAREPAGPVDGGVRWTPVDGSPDPRYLYSPEEAAHRLGISRSKVYQLIKARWLTSIKIGRRTLISDDEVRALISRLVAEPGLLARF